MPKNTTINLRVDSEVKEQAGEILAELGMTLSEAFNLMLHQVRIVRGLPFEIKQRLPYELNDGYGSYVCEFGHIHNYSKFDFEAVEREIKNPSTKIYNNTGEMWADIHAEGDNAQIQTAADR
ncbi:MAG: type II toxin-antitoxin system RelB/DinJ family antitoxin [Oscillospiraceae bacterium]|jgi:addiction module RelB/DinJ family antitoxin|nr:type II toxin-antitoxin system RelB/DinJ family antitoxin [Oscillospiraceae bacterium]